MPKKKYYLIFFAIVLQDIYSQSEPKPDLIDTPKDKILCISIPKCGTHLLKKCLALINPKNSVSYSNKIGLKNVVQRLIRKRIKLNKNPAPPHHFKGNYDIPTVGVLPHFLVDLLKKTSETVVHEHWPYTKESEDFFYKNTRANFFIIRDPRDHIVSMAFFLHKGLKGQDAPVQDLMLDFIDGRKKHYISWGVFINDAYPLLYEHGVTEFYKLYLPWMHARNFCLVKFENLVGPQGGGTQDDQLEEIEKIACHVGIKLTIKHRESITQVLFGNSATFREGMIGGWKKHFTPEMKQAFKNAPGAAQLLIDLGYEKDMNW